MAAQYWENVLNSPTPIASGTALANSAALTDVSPAPQYSLPAGYWAPGMTFKVSAAGFFSNTGTPTLLLGAYIGGVAGTAIAASGAITTVTTGGVNWPWELETFFTIRTIGSSGTLAPWGGKLFMPASLTQFQAAYSIPATAWAAVTFNTTTAQPITIGAQWGTANASNTLTLVHFTVEQLN